MMYHSGPFPKLFINSQQVAVLAESWGCLHSGIWEGSWWGRQEIGQWPFHRQKIRCWPLMAAGRFFFYWPVKSPRDCAAQWIWWLKCVSSWILWTAALDSEGLYWRSSYRWRGDWDINSNWGNTCDSLRLHFFLQIISGRHLHYSFLWHWLFCSTFSWHS